MRLGFHYHIPAIQKDGSIYLPGYIGVFLDSLASHCESLICFMHEPISQEVKVLGYKIKLDQGRQFDYALSLSGIPFIVMLATLNLGTILLFMICLFAAYEYERYFVDDSNEKGVLT